MEPKFPPHQGNGYLLLDYNYTYSIPYILLDPRGGFFLLKVLNSLGFLEIENYIKTLNIIISYRSCLYKYQKHKKTNNLNIWQEKIKYPKKIFLK